MCLLTKQKKPKTLDRDLKVYKIMSPYYSDDETARSPFMRFDYSFNRTYTQEIKESYGEGGFCGKDHTHYWMKDGTKYYTKGFHSFRYLKTLKHLSSNSYSVYICTIPKGSLVYENKFGHIISNKIIINERIK